MRLAPFDYVVNAPAGRFANAGGSHLKCRLLCIAEIRFALETSGNLFVLNLHDKLEVRWQFVYIKTALTRKERNLGTDSIFLSADFFALG